LAVSSVLLAGCDAKFTAELGSSPPADPAIGSVQVNLLGLEFRKADGGTARLEFRSAEVVDLLLLRTGEPLRLFTDEQLPAGRYTGVRLSFDADEDPNVVTMLAGGQFPMQLAEGAYATVDFQVEDEKNSRESVTLMLDLRQSLSFNDANDEYTLAPKLRAVPTNEAATIQGNVTSVCPVGTSLATGGAVYLFSGRDVEPDDLDSAGAEPFATTAVVLSTGTGFGYALRFLPPGPYTLALTCQGDEDVLGTSDDLAFDAALNVEVAENDLLQRDLD
jgi:hypothetical protein